MGLQLNNITPEMLNSAIADGAGFSLIKSDSTALSGILKGELWGLPRNLWLKRFNYKGTTDFLLKLIFGGRARRLWKINKKLFECGMHVPEPLLFIAPSLKIRLSFFLSYEIEKSNNFAMLYISGEFSQPDVLAVKLGQTVAEWHMTGAVHGDLKWSNILLQKDGGDLKFYLTDLDQARLYRKPNPKGIIKDIVRFYRYAMELGAEEWVERRFLPAYFSFLPDSLKTRLSLEHIRKRASEDWEKKGRRRLPA